MKKEDFTKGMKVRIKNNLDKIKHFRGGYISTMKNYEGEVVTIDEVLSGGVRLEEIEFLWDFRAFESLQFKKSLITDGCRVTLDNGNQLIYLEEKDVFSDINKKSDNCLVHMDDINQDGTIDGDNYIVKIEESFYKTIYEKDKVEIKEMTLAEICKELGYEVKIKKED